MTSIQKLLLDFLKAEKEIYRNSRLLYLTPADRAARVQFYERCLDEVERLIAVDVVQK